MVANTTLTVKQVFKANKKYKGNQSVNLVLADGTSFGLTAKVVSALPTQGEDGILYLVPIASEEATNTYEEYIWCIKEDETFGFEKIGTTDVNVILYDGLGQNTDGAMTQKAVTDVIGNIESLLHGINNGEES